MGKFTHFGLTKAVPLHILGIIVSENWDFQAGLRNFMEDKKDQET